jgi:hypothetical protein
MYRRSMNVLVMSQMSKSSVDLLRAVAGSAWMEII